MKFNPSIVQTSYQSPLGAMTLAATNAGLAGVWFAGQRHLPLELTGAALWPVDSAHPVLIKTAAQLTEYFSGRGTSFDLPLDLSGGTGFQQAVWQALLSIAPGQTSSYGQIGLATGKLQATSGRAVGAAVGRNPISIIVPCHRVVGAGGAMTGYAGGLDRKIALLKLENDKNAPARNLF